MLASTINLSREDAEAAAAAERIRIGRDLHDGAQQRIAAAALWLEVLETTIAGGDSEAAQGIVGRVSRELDGAIDDLRRFANGCLPSGLAEEGLDAAVRCLAARTPQPIEVHGQAGAGIAPETGAAAYFAASEGVTNSIRHSGADVIEIGLERRNGHLLLSVRDDGSGGATLEGGTGLRGLARRLWALDGSLELESPPGAGTTMTARLPVKTHGSTAMRLFF